MIVSDTMETHMRAARKATSAVFTLAQGERGQHRRPVAVNNKHPPSMSPRGAKSAHINLSNLCQFRLLSFFKEGEAPEDTFKRSYQTANRFVAHCQSQCSESGADADVFGPNLARQLWVKVLEPPGVGNTTQFRGNTVVPPPLLRG